MNQFFGVIEILKVENICPEELDKHGAENIMTLDHIRFIHYPDCQQLILWLPEYFSEYTNAIIRNIDDKIVVYDHKVKDIISGSIQILIDSLFVYPGLYELTIKKNNGLVHNVRFKKYPEGQVPEVIETSPVEPIDLDSEPIVYRDGLGNIIPDQDLIMRETVLNEMYRKFNRKVKYEGSGRSNTVIYIDGDKSIRLYSEMGGGNCLFYIDIPTKEQWEKETGFSLEERDEIIQFIAESTLRDQTSSSGAYFEIEDKWITFYKSKT